MTESKKLSRHTLALKLFEIHLAVKVQKYQLWTFGQLDHGQFSAKHNCKVQINLTEMTKK